MALLHQQGILKQGDHYIGESIIGSRFHCSIDAITKVGDRHAIYPLISGQAWITSTHQHILDHSSTFIRFEVPVSKTFPDQFMSDHA